MRWVRFLKIGDVILIVLVLIAFVFSFFIFNPQKTTGTSVSIFLSERKLSEWPLFPDRTIAVSGSLGQTIIGIVDGSVCILESPCPQKLCMKMGKIQYGSEWIACIPNRVYIQIEGQEGHRLDGITQ